MSPQLVPIVAQKSLSPTADSKMKAIFQPTPVEKTSLERGPGKKRISRDRVKILITNVATEAKEEEEVQK